MSLSSSHPVDHLIRLWSTLSSNNSPVVVRRPTNLSATTNRVTLNSIVVHFNSIKQYLLQNYNSSNFLLSILVSAVGVYVLLPSILPKAYYSKRMGSSKRPDKYTTGLINVTVDCFANSTLQSLSSLPELNNYLNDFVHTYISITSPPSGIPLSPSSSDGVELSDNDVPEITLHLALVELISKLQETIYNSRVVSVWDFLYVLENIYKSRISRNQHDAHELLQLILETLEREHSKLSKYVNSQKDKYLDITLPEFPFVSEIASSLRCLKCGHSSSKNYSPMMILSLNTPQENSIDLETLLKRNESEIIDEYSCLKCKLVFILAHPPNNPTKEQKEILIQLAELNYEPSLLINQDLSPLLQSFVDSYPGVKSNEVKSSVHKIVKVIKPPKILTVHLSRSIFVDTQAWRNSCSVSFSENLRLAVGVKDQQDFEIEQNEIERKRQEEREKSESKNSSNEKKDLNVDSEGNSVARVVVLAMEDKNTEEFTEDAGFDDEEDNDDGIVTEEEGDLDDETTVAPQRPQPVKRKSTTKAKQVLLTPPSDEQLIQSQLINYSYDLKSVIRHQGSHSLGHYECYKRKPIYYKNSLTGEYYQRDFAPLFNPRKRQTTQKEKNESLTIKLNNLDISNNSPQPGTSEVELGSTSEADGHLSSPSTPNRPYGIAQLTSDGVASESESEYTRKKRGASFSRFKSRMSSFVSSRSSFDVSESRRGSMAPSLAPSDTDSVPTGPSPCPQNQVKKGKDKKLASCIKNPYWRISDSKVNENAESDVLGDSKAVYMLFFQRY